LRQCHTRGGLEIKEPPEDLSPGSNFGFLVSVLEFRVLVSVLEFRGFWARSSCFWLLDYGFFFSYYVFRVSVSCVLCFLVSGFDVRVSGFWFMFYVSYFVFRVSCFTFWVEGFAWSSAGRCRSVQKRLRAPRRALSRFSRAIFASACHENNSTIPTFDKF